VLVMTAPNPIPTASASPSSLRRLGPGRT
jgi:hypothetical protein